MPPTIFTREIIACPEVEQEHKYLNKVPSADIKYIGFRLLKAVFSL